MSGVFKECTTSNAKYETAEEMAAAVSDYVHWCEENSKPISMARCALFLGFSSRQALYFYEKKGDDFKNVIDYVRANIQASLEEQLLRGRGDSGLIFFLKNFGYRDDANTEDETPSLEINFQVADAVSNIKVTKGKKQPKNDN